MPSVACALGEARYTWKKSHEQRRLEEGITTSALSEMRRVPSSPLPVKNSGRKVNAGARLADVSLSRMPVPVLPARRFYPFTKRRLENGPPRDDVGDRRAGRAGLRIYRAHADHRHGRPGTIRLTGLGRSRFRQLVIQEVAHTGARLQPRKHF